MGHRLTSMDSRTYLILVCVFAVVSGPWFWIWIFRRAKPDELGEQPDRELKSAVNRVTIVTILATMAITPYNIVAFLSPPAAPFFLAFVISWRYNDLHQAAFFHTLPLPALLAAVAASAAFWMLQRRSLMMRRRSLITLPSMWAISAAGFWLSFWVTADLNIWRIQADASTKLGLQCVHRSSLLYSANIAGAELQFGHHALGFKDGEPFGWSYSEMGFYAIPHSVARNVADQVYRSCYKKEPDWSSDS